MSKCRAGIPLGSDAEGLFCNGEALTGEAATEIGVRPDFWCEEHGRLLARARRELKQRNFESTLSLSQPTSAVTVRYEQPTKPRAGRRKKANPIDLEERAILIGNVLRKYGQLSAGQIREALQISDRTIQRAGALGRERGWIDWTKGRVKLYLPGPTEPPAVDVPDIEIPEPTDKLDILANRFVVLVNNATEHPVTIKAACEALNVNHASMRDGAKLAVLRNEVEVFSGGRRAGYYRKGEAPNTDPDSLADRVALYIRTSETVPVKTREVVEALSLTQHEMNTAVARAKERDLIVSVSDQGTALSGLYDVARRPDFD